MRGRRLLHSIMSELLIGEVDFYTSGLYHNVEKRATAIRRLYAAGLNAHEIGRLVKRDHTTVLYWIKPDVRQRRKEAMSRYQERLHGRKQKRRAPRQREEASSSPHPREP